MDFHGPSLDLVRNACAFKSTLLNIYLSISANFLRPFEMFMLQAYQKKRTPI